MNKYTFVIEYLDGSISVEHIKSTNESKARKVLEERIEEKGLININGFCLVDVEYK